MSAVPLRRQALPWIVVAAVALADLLLVLRNPADADRLLINVILALSAFATLHLRLLSLANAGFMAIGAYTSAILSVKLGLPVALSIPAAVLACGAVAMVIGLPVLKLKDVYLAIATLGFGEIVRVLIILLPGLTGGPTGANLSTGFPYAAMRATSTWVIAAALLFIAYLFWSLGPSKTGRAFRAIRENPQAAATMGINITGYKSLAFLLSALIAGLGGAFFAHSVGSLDNGDFNFTRAVNILGYAVLGGSGAWFGPILGAGLLTALPILIRDSLGASIGFLHNFAQLPNILTGASLMLVIIFMPGGLASTFALGAGAGAGARAGAGAGPDAGAENRSGAGASRAAVRGSPAGRGGDRRDVPEADEIPPPDTVSEGLADCCLLALDGVSRSFGGVEALSDVSLEIREGGVYGLIGPNGAGKTTLMNLVTGLFPPTSGRILWRGREIQAKAPHRIARLGISRTYQNIQLFSEMSTLENVTAGHHIHIGTSPFSSWMRLPRERREEASAQREATAILERLGMEELAARPAGTLSYGDQRRVEIARALALHPRLLLLDEPAAGMNETETERLGLFIGELKRHGYTILVVEHHMDLVMSVCDEIVVLNFGRKIAQGAPSVVSRDEAVLEAYLGRE